MLAEGCNEGSAMSLPPCWQPHMVLPSALGTSLHQSLPPSSGLGFNTGHWNSWPVPGKASGEATDAEGLEAMEKSWGLPVNLGSSLITPSPPQASPTPTFSSSAFCQRRKIRRKQRSRAPKEVKKCYKERSMRTQRRRTGQGHPVATTVGRGRLEVQAGDRAFPGPGAEAATSSTLSKPSLLLG